MWIITHNQTNMAQQFPQQNVYTQGRFEYGFAPLRMERSLNESNYIHAVDEFDLVCLPNERILVSEHFSEFLDIHTLFTIQKQPNGFYRKETRVFSSDEIKNLVPYWQHSSI